MLDQNIMYTIVKRKLVQYANSGYLGTASQPREDIKAIFTDPENVYLDDLFLCIPSFMLSLVP